MRGEAEVKEKRGEWRRDKVHISFLLHRSDGDYSQFIEGKGNNYSVNCVDGFFYYWFL